MVKSNPFLRLSIQVLRLLRLNTLGAKILAYIVTCYHHDIWPLVLTRIVTVGRFRHHSPSRKNARFLDEIPSVHCRLPSRH